MATLVTAREAIYQRMVTQWAAIPRTEPIMFEDRPTDPMDATFNPTGGAWVRLAVRTPRARQASLGPVGDRRFRRGGSIAVQAFGDPVNGATGVDTLLQAALGIFEGASFSGVKGNTGTPRYVGPDGRWLMGILEVDFDFDETR